MTTEVCKRPGKKEKRKKKKEKRKKKKEKKKKGKKEVSNPWSTPKTCPVAGTVVTRKVLGGQSALARQAGKKWLRYPPNRVLTVRAAIDRANNPPMT
jgi:hypothetical protein